jgi:hypothetical protein
VRLGPEGTEVAEQPVERMGDALWPWAERLKPAIVWLRVAGYLVQAGSGGGSVRPPGDPAGRRSFSTMALLGTALAGRSRVKPQQITSYQQSRVKPQQITSYR